MLHPAVLRGFPAFVVATYLDRQGFAEWLRGLAGVHPELRAQLAEALAELELAGAQYKDWRASEVGVSAVDGSTAGPVAAAVGGSAHEISTEQAADMLGVTPNRVRQLCRGGQLRARQVGKTWLVDAASVRLRGVA